MRIKRIQLKDFKRFNDLTIDLGESPKKIVALVGPNGSGKSSVFDGFEEFSSQFKGRPGKREKYYQKSLYQPDAKTEKRYNFSEHVFIQSDVAKYGKTNFYIRSAYRFTPRLEISQLRKLAEVENDEMRPQYLIDADSRLKDNYERLLGKFYDDVYDSDLTGKSWSEKNIKALNAVLHEILDISVTFLGNPVNGEGSLYFQKGTSKKFPYENLSAGEKEVIDLVLDIHVKKNIYKESVICIDEPELHLNTAIQRKLLIEIEKLLPDSCQLWVATHSIGFLRALQQELKEKTAVIDFTGKNFDETVVLNPLQGTRADWSRIFETALEDLTGLLAPRVIIYCEGRPEPSAVGAEQGLDADVYNQVFGTTHHDVYFVSSGGGNVVNKNALLALKVLGKAFSNVSLYLLKDRDKLSESDRSAFLKQNAAHRMLERSEIENYLFDREILQRFCIDNDRVFNEVRYNQIVSDIKTQDLKPLQKDIQACCQDKGPIDVFKRSLAIHVTPDTAVFKELATCIF